MVKLTDTFVQTKLHRPCLNLKVGRALYLYVTHEVLRYTSGIAEYFTEQLKSLRSPQPTAHLPTINTYLQTQPLRYVVFNSLVKFSGRKKNKEKGYCLFIDMF